MGARSILLAIAAVIAAASFAAGTASAEVITAEPAGSITATSSGNLTFAGRGGIEIAINCPVTLTGTMAATISNTAGSHVGSIAGASVGRCNTGNATPLVESRRSWELTLSGAARLESSPKLVPIEVVATKFQVEGILGQTCLYEGTVPTLLEGEGPREAVLTRNQRVSANSERIVRNSGLCPERGELRGEFRVTAQTLSFANSWSISYRIAAGPPQRDTLTFIYNGNNRPEVTELTRTGRWIEGALDCKGRRFNRGDECSVTLEAEANSVEGILTIFDNGVNLAEGKIQK